MAQLISTPRMQAFDDNGVPLSGGKMYFYEAGTSTPKNTYSDAALTVPNANPIELNTRGEALVFGSGSYKVVIHDSTDVLIYEEDDFYFDDSGLRADLASTATDDGTKGFHLVHYPPLTGETGVTDYEYKYGDVRRYGAVGDGVTDDSAAWNAALLAASGGKLYVPKPSVKYMVDPLTIPDDIEIHIEPGTIIEANAGYGTNDVLVGIADVSNISINAKGVIFQMPKAEYTTGEWRHCFSLRGATNVTIDGAAANDSGGDGFYIGAATKTYCENIKLINCSADNNKRQGLSVVSVKGLRVINPRLTNTTGTAPSAGIDIEPNTNADFMEDVVIDNPYTEGNDGAGITMLLGNFVGAVQKDVTITINNPTDKQSTIGLLVDALDLDVYRLTGSININNPVSIEPDTNAFQLRNYDANGPVVNVKNPVAIRPNESGNASVAYGSAFLIYREASDTGASEIGNINIENPTIDDDRAAPQVTSYFYMNDLTAAVGPVQVSVQGVIKAKGLSTVLASTWVYGSGIIEDKSRFLSYSAAATYTINVNNYTRYVDNTGSSGFVRATLSALPVGWPLVTFEITAANELRITPDGSSEILPGSLGVGKSIYSSTIGSKLTLRRFSSTIWVIEKEIGTWTREV